MLSKESCEFYVSAIRILITSKCRTTEEDRHGAKQQKKTMHILSLKQTKSQINNGSIVCLIENLK